MANLTRIRTLALIGAAGSGKTTLAEQLLHAAGAIPQVGTVEKGNTVSDYDPLEKRMQHSLSSSLLLFDHAGLRVYLIDTPGAPDFSGHSLPALEAVETAVVVIDAQRGIELMAQRAMDTALARGRDRVIVINRIDAPGIDLPALLEQIQTTFGRECLPLNLPNAGGVQDCFFACSGASDFGSVAESHRALVEQVVEVDPDFVERYLNEGDVPASELHAPLEQALREGHLVPILFTAAKSGVGVPELLSCIEKLLPNPLEANPPAFERSEGETSVAVEVRIDPNEHVLAHVFAVRSDPFLGKLGLVRVHQGTLSRNMQLYVGHARKPVRVAHLFTLQGKTQLPIDAATAGEICVVAKLDELHTDAVLHDAAEDAHLHLASLKLPTPVHGLAIAPARHGDEQRLWDVLHRLVEEDPCLLLEQSTQTGQMLVYGLGDLHLRVLLERLREAYRFEVLTEPPRIAYRETISTAAEGNHRHKKQTGGAGQFGEVYLRVEPLPRGGGFEFINAVKGGVIPSALIPAVEKGVREACAQGVIAGYPLVDIKVSVYDGKYHSVDSKEVAFVTAARKALQAAVRDARPTLLEPIVQVDVLTPEHSVGDVSGDLASHRGQVTGTRAAMPGQLRVQGLAPLAELVNFQTRLNALTSGQASYTLSLSHHEPVPPNLQQQLVSAYRSHEDE
ncbi:elongation factor G [Aquimonas sp.]|jgi:elongation factor G|uniref:elongation factor G n=1 Tax=Aquimonas sp. TaxID=1872588 RepID=UPI0037BE6E3A